MEINLADRGENQGFKKFAFAAEMRAKKTRGQKNQKIFPD